MIKREIQILMKVLMMLLKCFRCLAGVPDERWNKIAGCYGNLKKQLIDVNILNS